MDQPTPPKSKEKLNLKLGRLDVVAELAAGWRIANPSDRSRFLRS
jgi:hypothetical protein